MTPEQEKKLRAPFPADEVGKLPRITCPNCRKSGSKVCGEHRKSRCQECSNYITGAHIHLDYVGHAETTDRFLSVDPEWTWEPIAWTAEGTPAITQHGGNLVMWGRLTLCGTTRPGVGTAPREKEDAHKELIGDFLRNAGMRFGVALDLWRKSEKVEAEAEHAATPTGAPQTAPQAPVEPPVVYATSAQIKAIKAATRELDAEQRAELVDGDTVYGIELLRDRRIVVSAEQAEHVLTSLRALIATGEKEPVDLVAAGTEPF